MIRSLFEKMSAGPEILMNDAKGEIFVDSGEIRASRGKGILRTNAIGSCMVVTAYDPDSVTGGMAHVMLPGEPLDPESLGKNRYARNAIEEMMRIMSSLGAKESRLQVCLVGGGNVLGKDHDSPGAELYRSLTEILKMKGINPVARHVGGIQRRACALNVLNGRVTYTIVDSEQRTLWEANPGRPGSAEKIFRNSFQEENP